MGVMECTREDCEQIMCNDYLDKIGYICRECKDELISLNPKNAKEVKEFMNTSKDESKYLDRIFI